MLKKRSTKSNSRRSSNATPVSGAAVVRTARRVAKRYKAISPKREAWQIPLSKTARYKFTYNDTGFVASPVIGDAYVTQHVFSGNSAFDPDYTGVGVQPYGWDSYTGATGNGLYNKYYVVGSKITITVHDTAGFPVKVVIVPTPTPTPVATESDDLARMPNAKMDLMRTSTDTTNLLSLSSYMSTKDLYGLDRNPESLQANYNADPTAGSEWFWYICFDSSTTQVTQAGTCVILYDIKIDYYTILYRNDDVEES